MIGLTFVISIIGDGRGESDGIVAAFVTMVVAMLAAGECECDTRGDARGHRSSGRNDGRVLGNAAAVQGSGTCATCSDQCGR